MTNTREATGQAGRRGPLQEGEHVQITDTKGRMHTVTLVAGGQFQTSRGILRHDDVLGGPDGAVIDAGEGRTFQVVRPLLADYVLSMPRGAAIIYPKDSAQVIAMGDIFPGARVLESGVGSGGLALFLLSAIGESGSLVSVEKREDFAAIAAANVDLWFGARPPQWDLVVADLADQLQALHDQSFDRVVLDLLDPWSFTDGVSRVLAPGGVLVCYVTTVPQMSRTVESLRDSGKFLEPVAWDSTNRTWHIEGLAVRPDHRMIAHTGYLITARRKADGGREHKRVKHPAPAAEGSSGGWEEDQEWSESSLGLRATSPKKVRRVRRDLETKVSRWVDPGKDQHDD